MSLVIIILYGTSDRTLERGRTQNWDGMLIVQTSWSEASCECETGYGWTGFDICGE